MEREAKFLFNQFDINDNALAGMTLKSAGNFFPENNEEACANAEKALRLTGFSYLFNNAAIMRAAHGKKVFFSDDKFKPLQYFCDGIIYHGRGAIVCFPGGCPIVAFRDKKSNISGILHGSWKAVASMVIESFLRKWELFGGNPETTIVNFLPATCESGLVFDNVYFQNIVRGMPYDINLFVKQINKNYVSFSLAMFIKQILNRHGYVAKINKDCVCCGDKFWFYRRDDKNGFKYRNAAFIITVS